MSDGARAKRTFIVGDIHGCVDELERLLDAIEPGEGDQVCFLGDYVDRGPSPSGVVERLLRLRGEGPRCVFLKGNHEDMFLAYLGLGGLYGEAFLWNGGDATLESYGLQGLAGDAAAARLPPAHREFLTRLDLSAHFGEFLCVHAGVRPTRPLTSQSEEDLLWIREDFIDREHAFPYVILYGHTPQRDIRIHLPYKIGLDTGVVYGNLLSCLELGSKELVQIQRGTGRIVRRSLSKDFERAPARVP
jgi:serine/threonine protein phosphatase 1